MLFVGGPMLCLVRWTSPNTIYAFCHLRRVAQNEPNWSALSSSEILCSQTQSATFKNNIHILYQRIPPQ